VQILSAAGETGENTFQVTPAVGTQFPPDKLDNLVINVNGGTGGANNALVEQSAAGGALAANQFVVDIRGAAPGSGVLRTYTAAVQWPDINYQNIQVVSPNVTGTNLLVLGPDLNDPNGTQAGATFLGSGATIQIQNAAIFPNNAEFPGVPADNDFYRVVAQTTGTLDFQVYFRTFATTLLPAGGNLDIQVLDAAGNIIGDAAGTFGALAAGGARVRIPAVAGQSYFLDVFGANPGSNTPNGAVINGYNATIINTAPPLPFNLELSRSTITATVTHGGSGYTFPPTVTVSGAGGTGTGAIATAILTNGVVTSITVGEGTGYVAPLTVTITGGGGTGATATAAITDTGELPPTSVNDDSGRSQFDNVTRVNKPTIFLNLADGFFLNDLPGNGTTNTPPVGVIPIPFSPNATTPGFRVAIFDSSNAQTPVTAGFATQVAGFPGLYKFTFTTALPDGMHNLTAEVQMVDPATPTETGFGDQSLPLTLTIDTVPPPVTVGTVGNGNITNATFPTFFGTAEANAIIKVYALATAGPAIGQNILIAQTTAISLDGTNADPNGYWSVQSNISMNDPAFFAPADGARTISVTAEDLAGNITPAPVTTTIFIDTTGPQVTNVTISNPVTGVENNTYNLFGLKTGILSLVVTNPGSGYTPGAGLPTVTLTGGQAPGGTEATVTPILGSGPTAGQVVSFAVLSGSAYIAPPTVVIAGGSGTGAAATASLTWLNNGPTPLVQAVTINIQDGPDRTAAFLYNAIEAGITQGNVYSNGGITLVGDHVGSIAIQEVLVTNAPPVAGAFATATVQLIFELPPLPGQNSLTGQGEALPDDRYTLTVNDTAIIDPAGNLLDGVSNASEPNGGPTFPSGTGVPGSPPSNFVARFTIDSHPHVGVWSSGVASIDANGDGIWDPSPPIGGDQTNVDYQFQFGSIGDTIFSGDFAVSGITADGFDKLGSYGFHASGPRGAGYYWNLDLKGLGVPTWVVKSGRQITGIPVAGHFDNAASGDQIGLFDHGIWYLDSGDENNLLPGHTTVIEDGLASYGYPIVGNFTGTFNKNGTPSVDLATYQQATNHWSFDLNNPAVNGGAANDAGPQVIVRNVTMGLSAAPLGQGRTAFDGFGFAGDNARPVAADMNGDGVTDLGLYIRAHANVPGGFYFLVSDPAVPLSTGSLASLNHTFDPLPRTNPLSANPSIHDLYFKFLDTGAYPLVGNFDPPTTPGVPPASLPFGDTFSLPAGSPLSQPWVGEQGSFAIQSGAAVGADPQSGVAFGLSKANVAVVDGPIVSDVTVEATLADVPGGLDAGLIARYQGYGSGRANYYLASVVLKGNTLVPEIFLHKAGSDGGRMVLLNKGAAVANAVVSGTTVKFVLSGTTLQLLVNGNVVASATNNALTAGTVGMQTNKGGSWSNFSAQ